MDKKTLSERDICTKYISPALEKAGWNKDTQFLEEVSFTDGRIYVRGKITARGERKRADYILYYKPNIPKTSEPKAKIYVNGIDVSVLVSRELHFDKDGKTITTNLKDFTKEIIQEKYASLDDFLNKCKSTDKKAAIIAELSEQGILVDALQDAVDKEVDLFDLICHIAYDMPTLTRKERANNVKKRNYFTKYGEQARKVLELLQVIHTKSRII